MLTSDSKTSSGTIAARKATIAPVPSVLSNGVRVRAIDARD